MDLSFSDEMKSIWQENADKPASPQDWQSMLAGLRKYEKQVSRVNRGKTGAAIAVLLLACAALIPKHLHSWMVLAGLGWIALSLCLFLVLNRRWQFRTDALPLDRSSLELIGVARKALERERALFLRALPLLCFSVVVGLQLISLGVLRNAPVPDRILLHAVSVLAVAAVLIGGLRFRSRRFRREMQPLLDQLVAFETTWREP